MTTTLMIFQAIVSVLLILIVLLQFGKGAEAGLMSSGGADSVLTGGQQGNILSKITVVLSVLFLGNSILLSKIQSDKTGKSMLDSEAPIARPLNSDAALPTKATSTPSAEKKEAPAAKTDESKK
jgi:preprotein translocase subunit SecG